MLILVPGNLGNFQVNSRMAQYVSYAGFQRGTTVHLSEFKVFLGPPERMMVRVVPRLNLYIRSILFISNLYKNRTLRFDTIEFP